MNKSIIIIFVLLMSNIIHAEIYKVYKWVDENGMVHFSDNPVSENNSELIEITEPNLLHIDQGELKRLLQESFSKKIIKLN